jgi:Cdc6-like AAA superfamily ATPase
MPEHPPVDLDAVMTVEEARALSVAAGKVLQPRSPITTEELFAGRWDQLTTLVDAASQPGLHVAIYGERGVGKTSLANVVRPIIRVFDRRATANQDASDSQRLVVKTIASSGDTFENIWEKLFSDITWQDDRPVMGLQPNATSRQRRTLRDVFGLPGKLTIDDVRRVMSMLPGAVFIVDEFDRAATLTSRCFTDLIKALSDFAIDSTVVLVGVSDTIDQLVADHASINRALIQINLPRMEAEELDQILTNAERSLSVSFNPEARSLIVHISQGLPHYTHLIGLHAVRKAALTRFTRRIRRADVFAALKEAVTQAQQTVTEKHSRAVHSAHKEALYRHVLLACAITAATAHDALGFFSPAAMLTPLQSILDRPAEIATFNNHLSEFCQEKRGCVLERVGQPRAYRYRFRDPLLVPFIFMDALASDLMTDERLADLLGGEF